MFRVACIVLLVLVGGCAAPKPQSVLPDSYFQELSDFRVVSGYADAKFYNTEHLPQLEREMARRKLFTQEQWQRAARNDVRLGDDWLYVYLAWPDVNDADSFTTAHGSVSAIRSPMHGTAYITGGRVSAIEN